MDGLPDYSDSPCWGEPATTPVYNGVTHLLDDVAATCRAQGDHVLLYVADGLWGSAVDQAAVNGLMHQLELFTPEGSVDPGQGVVPNDEAVFGPLDTTSFPQGKLEVYVVDTNGAGDGYLCGWCDHPQLHMDGLVLQPLDGAFSVAIAAHETYHVIHQAYDADETMWVNESLAEAAMTANGFFTDVEWLQSFVDDPDQDWGPGDPGIGGFNYGAALLWGTALWERGGTSLMTAITAEPADGWEGIDAALDFVGSTSTGSSPCTSTIQRSATALRASTCRRSRWRASSWWAPPRWARSRPTASTTSASSTRASSSSTSCPRAPSRWWGRCWW
jgi:hypothetical protein